MTWSLYNNNKSDFKCPRGIAFKLFFCPRRMFGVNLWRIIRMMKTKLMILGYFLLPLQVASHFRPTFPAKRQVDVVGVATPCRKTTWMISRALKDLFSLGSNVAQFPRRPLTTPKATIMPCQKTPTHWKPSRLSSMSLSKIFKLSVN